MLTFQPNKLNLRGNNNIYELDDRSSQECSIDEEKIDEFDKKFQLNILKNYKTKSELEKNNESPLNSNRIFLDQKDQLKTITEIQSASPFRKPLSMNKRSTRAKSENMNLSKFFKIYNNIESQKLENTDIVIPLQKNKKSLKIQIDKEILKNYGKEKIDDTFYEQNMLHLIYDHEEVIQKFKKYLLYFLIYYF